MNGYFKYCIITILFFILFLFSDAQFSSPNNFKFKTYTVKDGLVHNYTKKCLEDSKGFLWIITQHGLSRFDGVNFKNFETIFNDTTSLPENDLVDIAIDNQDRIWLSYHIGLAYYNQSTHVFHIVKQSNNKALQSSAVVFDSKTNTIISANDSGYTKIDAKNLSQQKYIYTHGINILRAIANCFIDTKHRLWICVHRLGYFTIDLNSNEQYYYPQDIWPLQTYEDEKNQIWMSTWSSGLRKIEINSGKHIHTIFANNPEFKFDAFSKIQWSLSQSKVLSGDSILWVTNQPGGIMLFNKNKLAFSQNFFYDPSIKNGIPSDFSNSIYCNKSGILWICSWQGITKVNKQEQQFKSEEFPFLKTQFFYNRLTNIIDDPTNNKIAWIGVEGMGIFKIDKKTNKPIERYFYSVGKDSSVEKDINENWRWVKTMLQDHEKNIWATTQGGLIKIKNEKAISIPLKQNNDWLYPLNFLEYPVGTLWLTTRHGLLSFDINKNNFKTYNISQNIKPNEGTRIFDIIQKDDSNFIATGRSGTFLFNRYSLTYTQLQWDIKELDPITQHICYSVVSLKDNLYIGTEAGLIQYNFRNQQSTVIGRQQGLTKLLYNSLKKDANSNLWIYNTDGLFKYNPLDTSFQKFTTNDGIYNLSNDAISFFDYNKKFNIGYRMAITSFDPLDVNANKIKVNPTITDIIVNNQLLNKNIDSLNTNVLQLSYKQNDITFNFTAPDFTNSDKITFNYQLEGYDKDWINAGTKKTATYTNLKGGFYTFKVKAANSSGIWNDIEAKVKIKIATPFWKADWFYFLLLIAASIIGYMIYRYRLNQLIQLFKVRDTISKNLHDEIGATLSSINIYSDVARKKNIDDKETSVLLDRIYKASSQVMDSMNDIVWFVNPKNDTWDNIFVRMKEYAIPLLEAKNITPSFDIDETLFKHKLNMQQRQQIYFIFKEAINNIVKYAAAKNVQVKLLKQQQHLILFIQDDGKGFDINTIQLGNGLNNMQQRAIQTGGKLNILSNKGHGCTIQLQLPIT